MLLDDAIPVGWDPRGCAGRLPGASGPVSLDPALEREFEERVVDSSTLAFRVALGVLRHREDAEDVAQEAFLRAHRAFASLRDRDRFRAWLVRTAFRLALDRLRGEKRRTRREDAAAIEAPVQAESVETAAARAELRARVGEAVDALPEKLRIVTVLAAIQEHDVASVAQLLEPAGGDGEVPAAPGAQGAGGEVAMACERFRDALADVAAGAPAPAGVEAHLASCEACRAELTALRQALAVADDEMAGLSGDRAVARAGGPHPAGGGGMGAFAGMAPRLAVAGGGRCGDVAGGARRGVGARHRTDTGAPGGRGRTPAGSCHPEGLRCAGSRGLRRPAGGPLARRRGRTCSG